MVARIQEEAQRRLAEQLTQWGLSEEFVAEFFGHHALVTFAKGDPLFCRARRPMLDSLFLPGWLSSTTQTPMEAAS